jgi:ABC-type lipoprotein release transport system permease subunit
VAAVLGITMGVAALIVAFALSNGFRDEMLAKILEGTAHLSVVRADGRPIENYSELAGQLKQVNGVEEQRDPVTRLFVVSTKTLRNQDG